MRSVKNGKLFEDIPARSFCRLAQHALRLVKHGRGVKPAQPLGTGLLTGRPPAWLFDGKCWTGGQLTGKHLQWKQTADTFQLQYSE
jgi:hypothetical protein